MRKQDVKIGSVYLSSLDKGKLYPLKVIGYNENGKGWKCVNLSTGTEYVIVSAARFKTELFGDTAEFTKKESSFKKGCTSVTNE